jgi:hypothetical protein
VRKRRDLPSDTGIYGVTVLAGDRPRDPPFPREPHIGHLAAHDIRVSNCARLARPSGRVPTASMSPTARRPALTPKHGRPVALAISAAAVREVASTTHDGPTKAKAALGENAVFVVLQDTLTRSELNLLRAGESEAVLDLRRRWKKIMQHELHPRDRAGDRSHGNRLHERQPHRRRPHRRGPDPRATRDGPRGPNGNRGRRSGALMTVSLKQFAPPVAQAAGQQRGAFFESLSRVLRPRPAAGVLAAGDGDRQRIERDLRDAIQQCLTGLRIRVAFAAESFQNRGEQDASAALSRFGRRSSSLLPKSLRSRAVSIRRCSALTNWARRWPLPAASRPPVTVSARGIRRCRPDREFTCLATIGDAGKHAGPAQVSAHAWENHPTASVHDLRPGLRVFPKPDAGRGRTGRHRRAHRRPRRHTTVESTPSHGTRLHRSVTEPSPGRPELSRCPAHAGGKPAVPSDTRGRWGRDLTDPANRHVNGLIKGRLEDGNTGRQVIRF